MPPHASSGLHGSHTPVRSASPRAEPTRTSKPSRRARTQLKPFKWRMPTAPRANNHRKNHPRMVPQVRVCRRAWPHHKTTINANHLCEQPIVCHGDLTAQCYGAQASRKLLWGDGNLTRTKYGRRNNVTKRQRAMQIAIVCSGTTYRSSSSWQRAACQALPRATIETPALALCQPTSEHHKGLHANQKSPPLRYAAYCPQPPTRSNPSAHVPPASNPATIICLMQTSLRGVRQVRPTWVHQFYH